MACWPAPTFIVACLPAWRAVVRGVLGRAYLDDPDFRGAVCVALLKAVQACLKRYGSTTEEDAALLAAHSAAAQQGGGSGGGGKGGRLSWRAACAVRVRLGEKLVLQRLKQNLMALLAEGDSEGEGDSDEGEEGSEDLSDSDLGSEDDEDSGDGDMGGSSGEDSSDSEGGGAAGEWAASAARPGSSCRTVGEVKLRLRPPPRSSSLGRERGWAGLGSSLGAGLRFPGKRTQLLCMQCGGVQGSGQAPIPCAVTGYCQLAPKQRQAARQAVSAGARLQGCKGRRHQTSHVCLQVAGCRSQSKPALGRSRLAKASARRAEVL
jgi:hypothetical protein